jgi:hypothetical protein
VGTRVGFQECFSFFFCMVACRTCGSRVAVTGFEQRWLRGSDNSRLQPSASGISTADTVARATTVPMHGHVVP